MFAPVVQPSRMARWHLASTRQTRIAALASAALAAISLLAASEGQAQEGKSWQRNCPATAAGRTCIIYTQNGGPSAAGTVAARISIGRRDNSAVVVVDVSAPALKDRGFAVGTDNNYPVIATLESCDQISCRGTFSGPIADTLVQQFKTGREATLTYFAAPSVPVKIQISLKGFATAYAALTRSPN